MTWNHGFGRRIVPAGLAALAACSGSSGTGPNGGQLDGRVAAGVATVGRVSEAPAMVSFRFASQHLTDLSGIGAAAPRVQAGADRLALAVSRIVGTVLPGGRVEAVPIIRTAVLGHTFVYDLPTHKYVVDPNRTGAPATGVRFVLYQMNQDAGEPAVPLVETGAADLTDEGVAAPNGVGLRLVVHSPTATYLDYAFTISGSIGSATFTATGFMSDGTDRVEFDVSASSHLLGTESPVELTARIAVPSQQFSVTATITARPASGGSATVELTATSATDQIVVHASLTATTVDATIDVNGHRLATATGPVDHPTIAGANGRELTADELAAVGAITGFADQVVKLVAGLLEPIGALLFLGLGVGA